MHNKSAFLLAFGLAACAPQSIKDAAAYAEQSFTAADTAWLAYIHAPDCDSAGATAYCSKVMVIAQGAPLEVVAFDKVQTFYAVANADPKACDAVSASGRESCVQMATAGVPPSSFDQLNTAASAALTAFQDIVNNLPKKGS